MMAAIADCDVLLARGMGQGAYLALEKAGIQPITAEIRSIDEAVQRISAEKSSIGRNEDIKIVERNPAGRGTVENGSSVIADAAPFSLTDK